MMMPLLLPLLLQMPLLHAESKIANTKDLPVAPPPPPGTCARNLTEFKANDKLKKVYGESYDAWYKWESGQGADILPDGKGGMYVKVPRIGHWLGYKDEELDLQICSEDGKPYFIQNNRRSEFDDKKGDRIELGDGKRSAKFTRKSP